MPREYFSIHDGASYDITWGDSEILRHGGPWDRGSVDSYYRRGSNHYYDGDTYNSIKVEKDLMSATLIAQYPAGYEYNEQAGDFKEW